MIEVIHCSFAVFKFVYGDVKKILKKTREKLSQLITLYSYKSNSAVVRSDLTVYN